MNAIYTQGFAPVTPNENEAILSPYILSSVII